MNHLIITLTASLFLGNASLSTAALNNQPKPNLATITVEELAARQPQSCNQENCTSNGFHQHQGIGYFPKKQSNCPVENCLEVSDHQHNNWSDNTESATFYNCGIATCEENGFHQHQETAQQETNFTYNCGVDNCGKTGVHQHQQQTAPDTTWSGNHGQQEQHRKQHNNGGNHH
ncbi:hypothetical protein M2139_000409 [Enterococcus sp. PF1-24]|uniref:hypothetical protein n=1 Tax=unclassified Enterococcus TaxID=2608891 RepID=UPI002475FF35|nr:MULTISPECIES: hypothetical protein [unclassified Enterococcus]MDH6363434.1 hypothetical protein [Enterococcus sp. PFB1-1]MDH6400528.1 hypothetical protein [Enterococcus sp. PF1-24]